MKAAESAAEASPPVEELGEDPGAGLGIRVTIPASPDRFVVHTLLFIQDIHLTTLESNAFRRTRYSSGPASAKTASVCSPRAGAG